MVAKPKLISQSADSYPQMERIGSGGFGVVYKCSSISRKNDHFAKKILEKEFDQESISRFKREVQILSKLDHPNIVKIVDMHLDELPLYYVMPLYEHSLKSILNDVVGNENQIRPVYLAILNGVQHAHDNDVIHRDLKPENVLIKSQDEIVVTDFGLGRMVDSIESRLTKTGGGIGSVLYLAPEAMADFKSSTIQSDIFSLGRILYELYVGELKNFTQDVGRVSNSSIAAIIERCTDSNVSKRFQSVKELKEAVY